MKKVILNYKTCEYLDVLGLILDGVTHENVSAATDGRLVAHDVIEHNGVNTIGGICHELEALGVIWWVRGSLDDISRNNISSYTPYEVLANEVFDLAEKLIANGSGMDLPVPNNKYSDYDDDFKRIIHMAHKQLRAEIEFRNIDSNIINWRLLNAYFRNCIHFMRSGYRKAKCRYRRLNQYQVNSLYWKIADAIDSIIPFLEYEGQQVCLKYCLTSATASAQIVEAEYY